MAILSATIKVSLLLVNNKIGLIDNNESTIICGKQVWTMSETEIEEFEKDDSYMWWDK